MQAKYSGISLTQTLTRFNLLRVPEIRYTNIYYTSFQGSRMPVELVKDSTKGIVDLKRVHCIAMNKKG